jgi:bifunctional non-homologous end joining protein LigD
VSMPVDWDELGTIKGSDQWTIATAREHISFQKADPWADFLNARQTLTKAWRALGLAAPKQPESR